VANINVHFPNSNILSFPANLFLFFEVLSLDNATPAFISKVGVVTCNREDFNWEDMWQKSMRQLVKKHHQFFEEQELDSKFLFESFKDFLAPFVLKIDSHPKL